MSSDYGISRGSLAKQSGVNSETIRYYEKIGLMNLPIRSEGGHRIYSQIDLKRLFFIRRSRELGFSLEEIRALLKLVDGGDYSCAEVRDRTNQHLNDVTKKISDLRKIQRTLKDMISQCEYNRIPDCPIIETLFTDVK
jgi:MerR family transcriptional regulator, mercuric resistance operon regulatory protein